MARGADRAMEHEATGSNRAMEFLNGYHKWTSITIVG